MFVLDTNHFRDLTHPSEAGRTLRERMDSTNRPFMTTVVTAEEVLRGWLAKLAAEHDVLRQDLPYRKLADYSILPWDVECALRFKAFRAQGIRIGTLDLKIACITLEYDATLLTRNTVDFARVPGLRIDNWLD